MALRHHDLCFGCGRTNLFGLLAEIESAGSERISGRCFIKQDHQGPNVAHGHPGVVAAALIETMALCVGRDAVPIRIEVSFHGGAPVGSFLELEAKLSETVHPSTGGDAVIGVGGRASFETHAIASAVGSFRRGPQLRPADP